MPNPNDDDAPPAPSTNPPPSAPPIYSLEDEEEEVLQANFDNYVDPEAPLNPIRSPRNPQPTPTANSTTLDPSALAALRMQYPRYHQSSLASILLSVNNDAAAAAALLEGRAVDPDTANDAEIASRLQQLERTRAAASSSRPIDKPIALELAAMQRVTGTLKDIVVPSLRAHFQELIFPDTREDSPSLLYELQNVQVTALNLPSDNVSVTPAPDRQLIYINVYNAHLELNVGNWSYEKRGIVPLRDSGAASVSIKGMNIAIRLQPRWSRVKGTRIVIDECTVTVDGAVRLKASDSAASWAYNTIAMLLKPIIVSYIKESVSEAVANVLAMHLSQWARAKAFDAEETPPVQQDATPAVTMADL